MPEATLKINEAASILNLSREQILDAIQNGLLLPNTQTRTRLSASKCNGEYDITDCDLDAFIAEFEQKEPGRHPPVSVRRQLLVEARHRCAICLDSAPLKFHHMIDWARIKHHDSKRMLAVCGTCHDRCTKGQIDYKSQLMYKAKLLELDRRYTSDFPFDNEKRESDLSKMRSLFCSIDTGFLDRFFIDASRDIILEPIFWFWEGFRVPIKSTTFFLYDKGLLELVYDLHTAWSRILNYGSCFDRIPPLGRYGRFLFQHHFSEQRQEEYEQFHIDLVNMESAFRLLYQYVCEEFPELDLNETNEKAKEIWEFSPLENNENSNSET